MALQMILGASGSGKSYRLYEDVIRESVENPQNNYIVIVPEQFTMGTQEKIVKMHPAHGVLNVDIVSFPRLAYKVFEEMGMNEGEILDDTGKSLIVRKILEDKKDELLVFKKNIDKPGFVEEVKSAVSEMLQYGVNVEDLSRVAEKVTDNPLFSYKLKDIITVFEGFKSYINGKYIASEEILEVLCRVAGQSKMIQNSIITLDGFTGFTPIQYRLIQILMECCQKLTVTVTIDSGENVNLQDGMSNLFFLSKNTIRKLYRIADESRIEIIPPIVMEDKVPVRLKESAGLAFLEKNIFRYGNARFMGEDDSIQIFEGNMPKNEIAFAVGEIKRLIMEKGYHYRDFAIVSADIETYGELAVNILSQNDIPSFLDYKRNIMGNAAVAFIRGALLIVEEDFSYESVFGFLKTGFAGISREDTDILENYCLALGIKGYKRYENMWIRKTARMEKTGLSMEYVNSIRERVLELLREFREDIRRCRTVRDYATVLYEFMVRTSLEEKLKQRAKEFADRGELSLKGEYEQVYGKIIGLLDKFVALLGNEKVSFAEFNDILDAGFREIKVGLIPQEADAVMIGDIERTRLENIKVLFFTGVNDGIIPRQSGGGGIISESDKELLRENDVELSMTDREKVFVQKFYLYLSMTKPKERLYLSYARICSDGKSRKMSYLLISICKLFPNIRIRSDAAGDSVLRLVKIPQSSIRWKFCRNEIEEDVAGELYGKDYLTSISAVENFYSCAFAHFVTYGLRLSEREIYDIKASDIGTLYHDTLERFSQKLCDAGKTFTGIGDEERRQLMEESVMEITTDYGNTVLYSTKRNEYMISRVIAMADRTVWAIQNQLLHGKFVPSDFEKNFVLNKKVRGRIDRIDICEDENNVYVKVVDYKTGESDFDLLETYYGLKIQLVTYMNAAMAMEQKKHPEKEIVPAGMFYYNIKNPFVEDTEDIDSAILEKLRVKGILNDDLMVIDALDDTKSGKSLVIPASYNKDGEMKQASNLLNREQIWKLSEHVDMLIEDSVKQVLSGKAEVNPYVKDKKSGCDYCGYRSLCGFDEKLPDCKYHGLKNLSDEIIFQKISDQIHEKESMSEKGKDMKNGTSLDQ
ncbi:MAG: PD-(D/E)XK nuclease family protein [Thermoflexaceae bacterium]|nr:PD-(D/E)XK nuclease family protein [Thermoflexaceae bacterium]